MRLPPIFRTLPVCAMLILFAPLGFGQGGNPSQGPPGAPPKLNKIRNDLYMIENSNATMADLGYWGGNVTIYLTSDGVILADCKFERAHDDVLAKIKSLTDKPVGYVVLTHNHSDHAGGTAKFESEGAQIVIPGDDRANMLRAPNAKWAPSFAYTGQARIVLGGKEVQWRQLRGHTRGDTVAYYPAASANAQPGKEARRWDPADAAEGIQPGSGAGGRPDPGDADRTSLNATASDVSRLGIARRQGKLAAWGVFILWFGVDAAGWSIGF